jgi:hypothetical protein
LYINSPTLCLLELNAGDLRHDVYHHRRRTHTKEVIGLGEVLGAQAIDWCSKLCERGIYGFPVFSVGANQNIQIFGSARLSMKRNRVSADNQVFNLSGVES